MIFESSPRQSNNLPLEQVCQTIVETVGQVLKVDIAILCLNNVKQQYFVYHKSTINNTVNAKIDEVEAEQVSFPSVFNWRSTFDWNALKKTINITEKIIVIEAPQQNCQANQSYDLATCLAYQQANITSSLSLPLLYQQGHLKLTQKSSQNNSQDLVGVLVLYYCENSRTWESEAIKLATMMANQAALAID